MCFPLLLPLSLRSLAQQFRPIPRVLIMLQAGREEHGGKNSPLFTDAGYPLLFTIVLGNQSGHSSVPTSLTLTLAMSKTLFKNQNSRRK